MDSKKTIVISGGTSGIGLATARILVAQGHNVILLGRSVEKGEKAVDTLAAYAGQVRFIAAHVNVRWHKERYISAPYMG